MRRVDRILHCLKPVAIELRQGAQPVPAVGARPDIVLWNCRRRLRAEVSPVKSRQLLDRISLVLYRSAKTALSWQTRYLKTITLRIVKPTMIGASNAAFLDAAI